MGVTTDLTSDIVSEYAIRQYGSATAILNDFDIKMVDVIKKLRSKYANELSQRKHIIVLKEPVKQIEEITNEVVKNSKLNEPKTKVLLCCAIKMNGDVCGAKLKDNNEFCLRHMPKK